MLKILFVVSTSTALFAAAHGITHAADKDTALYAFSSQQNNTVALWWEQSELAQGAAGWVAVSHGQPVWKDSYEEAIESGELDGQRWRLGQNFWTTFDTNVDLSFGETEVATGGYYVVLERTNDGDYRAFLLDQATVRATGVIASDAAKTTGGIEIPLEHVTVSESAPKLNLEFAKRENDNNTVDWVINFGKHRLSTTFRRGA